jgi:hypothetical protein
MSRIEHDHGVAGLMQLGGEVMLYFCGQLLQRKRFVDDTAILNLLPQRHLQRTVKEA